MRGPNVTHGVVVVVSAVNTFKGIFLLTAAPFFLNCFSIRRRAQNKRRLKLIREHGSIEKILPTLEGVSKYVIPPDWIPDKVDNEIGRAHV